ncbi:MmgE/PrpD family protein [Caballeronia sp. ATUFL_M2_KS44]|uniref:MmgE/PrpD family protein n=1 Tax=Caballeronia sp. ATUFL_M2_KS44 TaxID=2921767 RepID=UPI002028DDCD|nr:MmgE/PrpD family protein [Caballeronia sp. ATUFL_M2_KS44]
MDESVILARHVAATRFEALPAEAVRAAELSLLDALGVMFAATGLAEACLPFSNLARASGGHRHSVLLDSGVRVPATAAALANGALAHAVDFEDTHDGAVLHPNASVIPAAMAVSGMLAGASGKDLLTAIAVGADVVCRLGLALKVNPHDKGWYHPPMLGAFGAAAAAASMLRLTQEQVVAAFSLAMSQSVLTSQFESDAASSIRAVRDGFAAQAGVVAALLARDGVNGFAQPFEGSAGWFAMYADGQFDGDCIRHALGERFEGAYVGYKLWPSCRGTYPFIEAALRLREEGVSPERVAQIELTASPLTEMLCEPFEQKQRPATAIDAKFSIPFTTAAALITGQVGLDTFATERLNDSRLLSLTKKMSYRIDTSRDFKAALTGTVRVVAMDGGTSSVTVERPRGSVESPMTETELREKFYDCCSYHAVPMTRPEAQRIANTVLNVRWLDKLEPLWECLTRAQ